MRFIGKGQSELKERKIESKSEGTHQVGSSYALNRFASKDVTSIVAADQLQALRIKGNLTIKERPRVANIVDLVAQGEGGVFAEATKPTALSEIVPHMIEVKEFGFPLRPIGTTRVDGIGMGDQGRLTVK